MDIYAIFTLYVKAVGYDLPFCSSGDFTSDVEVVYGVENVEILESLPFSTIHVAT